ncbi:SDR family oxidoreductase [Leptospira bandrabouensis]|uniref:SDR family oxidoreductase n=1 Tax=Leptospira bandrabouensis TaxID=2484903 RepID=UPI00223E43BE|nr:SDR family oxidoreductase [Leptospira bandrabouensis]MCW7458735.1 SDR family oxidoreductase [Leptospira bandrabouensis]MCW7478661.1 SDR family oxidoreductase [Leptospira bandrabouensis]MCW7486054.1 SDR family oxidoreductase [Leptospira bandrabouensis]
MDIDSLLQDLKSLLDSPKELVTIPEEKRLELMILCGKISRPDRNEVRKRNRTVRVEKKQTLKSQEKQKTALTGIRRARENAVFQAPLQISNTAGWSWDKAEELANPKPCYICKTPFTKLHFFYDSMCPSCAELNYSKRFQTADLRGTVAVITGSRLKIGYQATLLLLRSGARVIATTRFPNDSAIRFSKETDFHLWKDRLQIFGLDLRHTPSVEIFCKFLENHLERLDILINNAAQTVRRPPGFYSHLLEAEKLSVSELPQEAQKLLSFYQHCKQELDSYRSDSEMKDTATALAVSWNHKTPGVGIRSSAALSQIPYSHDNSNELEAVFPEGQLDADLQQVDLRKTNSWRLKLGEINTSEMLEVQLVNAVAPFVLCNRLVGIMRRDNTGKKHIINVSAMEGKFHRFKKEDRHPHTNMAKAALNMMTHTSAEDFAIDGIFMNAVDTGWVTDEDPIELAKRKQDLHDFQPPLDIVDGAARVVDPLFDGVNTGKHWIGKFLKDYFPIDW